MQVILSVTILLVNLSGAISISTYECASFCSEYVGDNFIVIMQMRFSVAIIHVVFSAVQMHMIVAFAIMQVTVSVKAM